MNRETSTESPAIYVVDTHALYWYLRHPERLGAGADAVFRLAESGNALIVVPVIVVAELYFLSVKMGQPFSISELLDALDEADAIRLSSLGRPQLEQMANIEDVSEMHDRLVAAEAAVLNAAVVTRDEILQQSRRLSTVW